MKKWNSPLRDFVSSVAFFGLCLKRKNGILLKLLIFRRMEELRKAKPDFILNEVPFSSSPFLFKGLRFERSLLGGKVPC